MACNGSVHVLAALLMFALAAWNRGCISRHSKRRQQQRALELHTLVPPVSHGAPDGDGGGGGGSDGSRSCGGAAAAVALSPSSLLGPARRCSLGAAPTPASVDLEVQVCVAGAAAAAGNCKDSGSGSGGKGIGAGSGGRRWPLRRQHSS
jgi:hypothetical protein